MIENEWFEGRSVDEPPRIVVLPWLFWVTLAFAMILTPLLYGCAEDRFLTKEQDEEFRQNCYPQGCAVIPNPMWNQIKRALGLDES